MLTERIIYALTKPLSLKQTKQIHALVTTIGERHELHNLLLRQTLLSTNIAVSRHVAHYTHRLLRHCCSVNADASQWSFAVRFFSRNGYYETALEVFVLMQTLSLSPSSFAFSSSLKACAKLGLGSGGLGLGGSVHSRALELGLLSSVYVLTSLMDFYGKTGHLRSARRVFDEMPERNVVSWNAMLSCYLRCGDLGGAREVFDEMPGRDVVSWNSMISGYAKSGDMACSIELFERTPEKDSATWNAVIGGYASLGDMGSASRMFEEMPLKNVVSWVTMISGYSKLGDVISARSLFDRIDKKSLVLYNGMIACYEQNNHPKESIELFNQMVELEADKITPDELTLTSVVSACSQLGYLGFGLWVESYAKNRGIPIDDHLTNAFIDLYAKCGNLGKALELFNGLGRRDVVSYSAMISGFSLNGKPFEAINLFQEMVHKEKISPNLVTFKGLLAAFNHAGLVEEGYKCFESMKGFGLVPSADHYGIMVDLLGRSGRVEEAYELITNMTVQASAGAWGALLMACRQHGNVELGEICARKCFELQPKGTGHKPLLAGIYASMERWNEAAELRSDVEEPGFIKTPGCSWMESN